ncbi:MAG: AarF/UbiB family protein [Myxococcota bacterium]
MAGPNVLNTVKDLDRLRQIVGVLVRHGFGELVNRTGLGSLVPGKRKNKATKMRMGERIRLVLQELGPSFVKLGQIASTRPDVFPADVVVELKKLQDDVPPESFESIRPLIENELGAPISVIFESFDETPLASASIGQVHRATLKVDDGVRDVVVKVQRPHVRKTMELDIDLLYWLAHAIERSIPEAKLYQPVKMVNEFDRAVTCELDFVLEADNAERFARNFEKKRYVKFPKVYREASSRRVLTLEFLDGKKVHNAIEEDGHSGEQIAKTSVDIIVQQIFEDGFFHADPHPGNVFIMGTPDRPVVAMMDLGLVGHLTPQLRDRTIDLMVSAVREDYRGVADALWAIGRATKKVDRQAFEAEVTMLAQKYLGKKLGDIDLGMLLKDLVDGARRYSIEIPAGFLMMGKALMTVEGVGREIYPELDVFAEVKPYFLRLIQQRYSPERITQDVIRGVMRLSNAAQETPLQIQEILEDLRSGAFRVQVREPSIYEGADRIGRRIFSGLVVASTILGGSILLAVRQHWVGGILLAIGVTYAAFHSALVFLLNQRRTRD